VLLVELPDEDFVEPQIDVQDESARRIGLDHVDVSSIVSAKCEAAGWTAGWLGRADLATVSFDV